MVDECKPNAEKFKGSVIEYNKRGEDGLYFVDLYRVQKLQDSEKPGEYIVHFLNNWGMRLKAGSTTTLINDWYTDLVAKKLKSLPEFLTDADLNNGKIIESMIELYCGLDSLKGINDTGASKILHILKPGLFVMWDNPIREHYMGSSNGSGSYILFLKKMQEIDKCLRYRDNNIFRDIFSEMKNPLENNLENVISRQKNRQNIIDCVKENEKIESQNEDKDLAYAVKIITKFVNYLYSNDRYLDAKFIDEYNWMEFTKNHPEQHSQHFMA